MNKPKHDLFSWGEGPAKHVLVDDWERDSDWGLQQQRKWKLAPTYIVSQDEYAPEGHDGSSFFLG